jgi:hypothetical protein
MPVSVRQNVSSYSVHNKVYVIKIQSFKVHYSERRSGRVTNVVQEMNEREKEKRKKVRVPNFHKYSGIGNR